MLLAGQALTVLGWQRPQRRGHGHPPWTWLVSTLALRSTNGSCSACQPLRLPFRFSTYLTLSALALKRPWDGVRSLGVILRQKREACGSLRVCFDLIFCKGRFAVALILTRRGDKRQGSGQISLRFGKGSTRSESGRERERDEHNKKKWQGCPSRCVSSFEQGRDQSGTCRPGLDTSLFLCLAPSLYAH